MAQAKRKFTTSPALIVPVDPLFALIAAHRAAQAAWLATFEEESNLEESIPTEQRRSSFAHTDTPESDIDADGLVIVETDDPRWIAYLRQYRATHDASDNAALAIINCEADTVAACCCRVRRRS